MKKLTHFAFVAMLAAGLAVPASAVGAEMTRMEAQIRKEIVTLPYYSLFDNLSFKVDGSKVTLMGEVVRPTLKTSVERVVKNVEGVSQIDNQIKVLPLSPNDDRIRIDVYRAIYYNPMFNRYAMQAVPPIHIIVENGDVTLEGVVNSESEKNVAGVRANGVPGVFSVTNNLQVERD
ncbi:MAG: BON domain-containing protein [Bryobacterales bacterium]|nr:BON domain-containing protein [Acidobacteriota bacterium]MCB9383163.1 BON domain-containing protein [Bryobacterales bacterium]